jgi:hypothetical protein
MVHIVYNVSINTAAATAMPQSGRGPCQGPGDEPGTVPLWPDGVDLLVWRGMLVDHGARFNVVWVMFGQLVGEFSSLCLGR